MARPREFDEAEVLDAALTVFWERGYDGTSVQDLVDATGLGRASLYGAFGDKEQLFARVLQHYGQQSVCAATELQSAPSVLSGIEQLLRKSLDANCPRTGPRGCFALLTASTTPNQEEFRSAFEKSLRAREKLLGDALARGQASGEICVTRKPLPLARWLIVTILGLAMAARTGRSRRELDEVVDEVLATLRGNGTKK